MTVLGLRFCARAFPSRGKRGPLLTAARGPLTIAASPAAEHRPQTRRLSNCGPRAQSLRGTRDPPRPGLEPVSPAPAGRLSTTAPPGKPQTLIFNASAILYSLDHSSFSFLVIQTILSSSYILGSLLSAEDVMVSKNWYLPSWIFGPVEKSLFIKWLYKEM